MPIINLTNEYETIHYHYIDKGSGPTLLLFHGFTGSVQDWMPLIDELSPYYRLIAIDLPGHGDTVIDPPDVENFEMRWVAVDMAHILEELNIQQCHLLGYSMGGRLALYTAINHPHVFKSLILESASPGIEDDTEREERKAADEQLADDIEAKGIEWFVEHWESLPMWDTQTDDMKAKLRKERAENDPVGLAYSLRGMGQGVMPSQWNKLSRLHIPVHLIAGAEDNKYVEIAQKMDNEIANSELTVVDGAGHNVHLENPEAFASAVRLFLETQER